MVCKKYFLCSECKEERQIHSQHKMLAMDDSVLYYHGEKSYYDVEVFISAAEGKMPNAKATYNKGRKTKGVHINPRGKHPFSLKYT